MMDELKWRIFWKQLADSPVSLERKLEKCHRFTIIEFLIVISIIAILAALLLPALNQARKRGEWVTCTNNLKTIGMILNSYTTDYNDIFPTHYVSAGTTTNYWGGNSEGRWTDFYRRVVGDYSLPTWVNYVPSRLLCPAVSSFPNLYRAKVTGWAKFDGWLSLAFYGINTNRQSSAINGWKVHRFYKVFAGSSKILMVETNQPDAEENRNKGSWCIYPTLADPLRTGTRINYSHNNNANVLYFDLHVAGENSSFLQENAAAWSPYSR